MPKICINCGKLVLKNKVTSELVFICENCGANWEYFVSFCIVRDTYDVLQRLKNTDKEQRIIEFAKLIIERKIEFVLNSDKDICRKNLVNKLKELGEIKLAVLLKLILTDMGD